MKLCVKNGHEKAGQTRKMKCRHILPEQNRPVKVSIVERGWEDEIALFEAIINTTAVY